MSIPERKGVRLGVANNTLIWYSIIGTADRQAVVLSAFIDGGRLLLPSESVNTGRRGRPMSDYELIMIVLTVMGIIVNLLIALM